ncbi:MAG: hypothetical protein S4CHLAM27_08410 [Chlamydiia bacterium]|nr:hypothetical protein [Chlamydiia bacterium]
MQAVLDPSGDSSTDEWSGQRVVSLVLPFLSLHSGVGSVICITMNGGRVFSSLCNVYDSAGEGYAVYQLSLTVISAAGSVFSFTAAKIFTSLIDFTHKLRSCRVSLSKAEYRQFSLDFLHAAMILVSIAMLKPGQSKVTVATLSLTSFALKGAICVLDAFEEHEKGRNIEAIAKCALGMIHLHKAGVQNRIRLKEKTLEIIAFYEKIEATKISICKEIEDKVHEEIRQKIRANELTIENCEEHGEKLKEKYFAEKKRWLNSLVKYRNLLQVIEKSKELGPNDDIVLTEMDSALKSRQIIHIDYQGKRHNIGAHFSAMGGSVVKGQNLHFIETEKEIQLLFKLNHVHRNRLEGFLNEVGTLSKMDRKELSLFLHLNQGLISDVNRVNTMNKVSLAFKSMKKSIEIGMNKQGINTYDRVIVKVPKEEGLKSVQAMLSILGLQEALRESSEQDLERMKLGHLFHTLCPKEALKLEREEEFFTLPLPMLKEKMIAMNPLMQEYTDKYLDNMELAEITPGRKRYRIHGLLDEVEANILDVERESDLVDDMNLVDSFKSLKEEIKFMEKNPVFLTDINPQFFDLFEVVQNKILEIEKDPVLLKEMQSTLSDIKSDSSLLHKMPTNFPIYNFKQKFLSDCISKMLDITKHPKVLKELTKNISNSKKNPQDLLKFVGDLCDVMIKPLDPVIADGTSGISSELMLLKGARAGEEGGMIPKMHLACTMKGVYGLQDIKSRLFTILQTGLYSVETRYASNISHTGMVKNDDVVGGNDSVYLQAISSQKDYDELQYAHFSDYYSYSTAMIIVDPKVLEFGTFQYHADCYGTRKVDGIYSDRENIIEFMKEEVVSSNCGNEVMVKDCIAPEHIKGIVVRSQKDKEEIKSFILENNLLPNKDVDAFIKVGSDVDHEWARREKTIKSSQ